MFMKIACERKTPAQHFSAGTACLAKMVRLDVSISRDDQRVVTSSGINNSLIWVDCTPGA